MSIARVSFSGHESFPVRYSWLKKAVDGVAGDPYAFSRADAMVQLGVGKNMVTSMRHWALSLGMLEEAGTDRRNRNRILAVTPIGTSLFGDSGWDPFLEDPGTVWLLHWKLVSRPERATAWWWVFNHYPGTDFTKQDLQSALESVVAQNGWSRVTSASLKRDIDVFVRTYSPPRRAQVIHEDTLESPLSELGLIRESSSLKAYRLVRSEHRTLPTAVFTYALIEYLGSRNAGAQSVTLEELSFGEGAPGRVFSVNERGLLRHLEEIETLTDGAIAFDETAGLKQIYVHELPERDGVLRQYYGAQESKD